MPEIGGKSVLVHASDNRRVWIIKDAIWGNRRCVADARKIFAMLNIWSCRRFTILLCEWVLTENYIGDDLQPMRDKDTGQREVQGGVIDQNISILIDICTIISYRNKHKHLLDQPQHQHNSYCKIIIYLSLQNTQSLFPASPSCIICFSFCSWKSAHR